MSAMSASHLETKRLRLVPHAPKHMLALIQGPDSYERGFGWRPAAGLRDFIVSKDVSPDYLAQLDGSAVADPWTHGFGLIHMATGTVIGFGGFKRPARRRQHCRDCLRRGAGESRQRVRHRSRPGAGQSCFQQWPRSDCTGAHPPGTECLNAGPGQVRFPAPGRSHGPARRFGLEMGEGE